MLAYGALIRKIINKNFLMKIGDDVQVISSGVVGIVCKFHQHRLVLVRHQKSGAQRVYNIQDLKKVGGNA